MNLIVKLIKNGFTHQKKVGAAGRGGSVGRGRRGESFGDP